MHIVALVLIVTVALASPAFALQPRDRKGDENRGMVLLDATTFPKIVPSDRHATVVLFSNKAQFGDAATMLAREEFLEVVQGGDKGEIRDLLFGQVIVNGGYNAMLAERVGLSKGAKEPGIVIYEKGSSTPIVYPHKKITGHLVRKFLSQHSGYMYTTPNKVPKLSTYASRFIGASSDRDSQLAIIAEAKAFSAGVEAGLKEVSAYYCKVMETIMDKGFEWAEKEYLRLVSVLEGGHVTIESSLLKLEMKKEVVSEFDRPFLMDPNREVFVPKAAKRRMEEAAAAKEAAEGSDIDMASLKDSINADL